MPGSCGNLKLTTEQIRPFIPIVIIFNHKSGSYQDKGLPGHPPDGEPGSVQRGVVVTAVRGLHRSGVRDLHHVLGEHQAVPAQQT